MRTSFKKTAILYISTAICLASMPIYSANSYDSVSETAQTVSFNNQLVDAAESGDNVRLKSLLSSGQDTNQRGEFESTALLRATYQGNFAAVKLLLSYGANPNLCDLGGATPLHFAVRNSNADLIDLLLKNGADVNLADSEGYTPLMRASINGDAKTLERLLASGADTNKQNAFGETALKQAAEGQNKDAMFTLLSNEEAKNQAPTPNAKALDALATASGTKALVKTEDKKLAEVPTKLATTNALATTKPAETKLAEVAKPVAKAEPKPDTVAEKPKITATAVVPTTTKAIAKAEPEEDDAITEMFSSLFDDEPTTKTQEAKPTVKTEAPKVAAVAKPAPKQEISAEELAENFMTSIFGSPDKEIAQNQKPAPETKKQEVAEVKPVLAPKPEVKKDEKISFHAVDSKPVVADIVPAPTPKVEAQKLAEVPQSTAPKTNATSAVAAKPQTQQLAKTEPSAGTAKAEVQKPADAPLKLTEEQKIYMLNFGSFASDSEAKVKLSDIKQKAPALSKDINFKLVQKNAMGQKLFYLNAGQFNKKEEAVEKCRSYISSGVNCRPQETKILYSNDPQPAAPALSTPIKTSANTLPNLAPAAGKNPAPHKVSADELFNELADLEEAEKKRLEKPKPIQYKDLSPVPPTAELEIPKVITPPPAPKPVATQLSEIPAQSVEVPQLSEKNLGANEIKSDIEQAATAPVAIKTEISQPSKIQPTTTAMPLVTVSAPTPTPTPTPAPATPIPVESTSEAVQPQKPVTAMPVNLQPQQENTQPAVPRQVVVTSKKGKEQYLAPEITNNDETHIPVPIQEQQQPPAQRIVVNSTIPNFPPANNPSNNTIPQQSATDIVPTPSPFVQQQTISSPVDNAFVSSNKIMVTKKSGQSVSNYNYGQQPVVAQNAQPIITSQPTAYTPNYTVQPPVSAFITPQSNLTKSNSGGTEMWVSAKYFTNQNAARGFWNQIKMASGGNYDGLRMRTQRGIARDSKVSAEIGPIYSKQDAQKLCTEISTGGVGCEILSKQSSSRYGDIQAASGLNVAGEEINSGTWSIQLGTYSSRDTAMDAWNNLKIGNSILNDLEFRVDDSSNLAKLRAGNFGSAAAAESICDSLRRNYVSCITVRG